VAKASMALGDRLEWSEFDGDGVRVVSVGGDGMTVLHHVSPLGAGHRGWFVFQRDGGGAARSRGKFRGGERRSPEGICRDGVGDISPADRR
jgi:hypothetical protein